MKYFIKLLIVIAMGLFLNSCYYDSFPQDTDDNGGGEIPDVVSYKDDIMPLWEGQCVACHNGNTPPDLRPQNSYNSLLDGYVEAEKSEESILYLSLMHAPGVSPMPTPDNQWPASKTNLVKGWIDQGAKNN
jgi:pentatricopeptide repeat protein